MCQEKQRLYLDGNIVYQDLKDDVNLRIIDVNFEHQYEDKHLLIESQYSSKYDFIPSTNLKLTNYIEQTLY